MYVDLRNLSRVFLVLYHFVRREIEIPLQLNLCPVGEVFHNLAIKCFFFFFFFFLLAV